MLKFERSPRTRPLTLLIAAGILALAAGVWATTMSAPAHEQFLQGNKAYSEGRFQDAVAHYHAAARADGVSASLLFNLGNAYQRMGNTGQAVLSYERALLLDPGDTEVRANLAKVRKALGLFQEPAPVWIRVFDSLSVNAWAWLASGAFSLLGLVFLVRGLVPFLERRDEYWRLTSFFPFRVVVTLLVLVMAASAAGVWTGLRQTDRAVVIEPDLRLLVSPFESAESVTRIKEGRAVEVLKEFGEYAHVRTKSGQTGWVPGAAVESIVPRLKGQKSAGTNEPAELTQRPARVTEPGSSS